MQHLQKHFDYLIGALPGLSERQLRTHFKLYEGYVRKTNEIEERMKTADRSGANYCFSSFSELHRRQAVAYNGAYLHQLYFENLTAKETSPSEDLKAAIEKSFGSMDDWFLDVKGGLKSVIGWVLVTRSRRDGLIRNNVVEEHHSGLLVEQDILLAFDGWEHAYFIDYGTAKDQYIEFLGSAINWEIANLRFEEATRSATEHPLQLPASESAA